MAIEYIDKNEHLDELKRVEVEILDYFVSVCQKNNLAYYLGFGTLLGAVRHKGFIPWDDDIDVLMKPTDYFKLEEILSKNTNKKYFFQGIKTEPNYYLLWNKIRKNNTYMIEKGWENMKINKGISIDIFPLIPCPNDKNDRKKTIRNIKLIRLLIESNISNDCFSKNYGKKGHLISKIIKILPKKLKNNIVMKKRENICFYKKEYDNYISLYGLQLVKKDCFEKNVKLDFENKKYAAPYGYKTYLTEIYGDYMKLPPVEERNGHGEVYLSFNTGSDEDEKR